MLTDVNDKRTVLDERDLTFGDGPRISRRTVAKGAAWSVPIIMLASATPAFAASSCLALPIAADWKHIKSAGVNNQAIHTYPSPNENVFTMWAGSTLDRGVNTATVTATSGAIDLDSTCSGTQKYTLEAYIRTQAGCDWRNGHHFHSNVTMKLSYSTDNLTWTPLLTTATQEDGNNPAGANVIDNYPPWSVGGKACTNPAYDPNDPYPSGNRFGSGATLLQSFTVPGGADKIYLQMLFTLWGNEATDANDSNDDYNIVLRFADCECVSATA